MKKLISAKSRKENKGGFAILHRRKLGIYSTYTRKSVQERKIYLRTREIINDIHQIIIFMKKIEELGFHDMSIKIKIKYIQEKLRRINNDAKSIQIIVIVDKYLIGMKKFSLESNMKGIFFYKQLFEGVICAIFSEISLLEEEFS